MAIVDVQYSSSTTIVITVRSFRITLIKLADALIPSVVESLWNACWKMHTRNCKNTAKCHTWRNTSVMKLLFWMVRSLCRPSPGLTSVFLCFTAGCCFWFICIFYFFLLIFFWRRFFQTCALGFVLQRVMLSRELSYLLPLVTGCLYVTFETPCLGPPPCVSPDVKKRSCVKLQ